MLSLRLADNCVDHTLRFSVDANPSRRLTINHQVVFLLLEILKQQIQLVNVQKDHRENLIDLTGIFVREERWKLNLHVLSPFEIPSGVAFVLGLE